MVIKESLILKLVYISYILIDIYLFLYCVFINYKCRNIFISNMVLSAWNFEENKGKTEILIKALKRVLNLANSLRKLEVKETAEEVENEKA